MMTALWLLAATFVWAIYAALALALDGGWQEGLRRDAQLGMMTGPLLFAAIYALSGSERRNLGTFAKAVCVIAGLGVVASLGSGMSRLDAQPREFTSATGRFTVTAPVSLSEKTETLDLGDGVKVQMHSFVGERRGIAYIASYVDYPDHIVQASTPDDMLDGAVQGQSEQPGARLVSADPIALEQYPGRAVRLEADSQGMQFTLRARSYMVGNRLYQLISVQKRGTQEGEHVAPFLASFKLTGAARDTRRAAPRVAR
jgi:hypothetical protein